MSYNSLKDTVNKPYLTASKLRHFRKAHLAQLCSESAISFMQTGKKQLLKEDYIEALIKAVSHNRLFEIILIM